jgi:polysaccharide deacetylase 2 family uncharacterized protein YibQ
MKSVSKGLIFTYILLAIAFIEGLVVIYDLLRPETDKFSMATAEIAVAERHVVVPPMLFEQHSAQRIAQELDEMVAEYMRQAAFMKRVTSESVQDKSAEDDSIDKKDLEKQDANKNLSADKKYIAIVIDDLGVSPQNTKDIISLKKPLTASFLPYAPANKKQVQEAKDAGFEVMLHVPMMPYHRSALAPVTLAPEMDKATVQKHLREFMAYFDGMGMSGINNHMGSEFTENSKSLGYVMEVLKEKGWYFLDSKTTGKSAGRKVAAEFGVPYIARDVFLDNENDYNYIMGQLQKTEKVAEKYGAAVAVGHPHPQTYNALKDWLKTVEDRGFVLVHVSDLIKK